MTEIDCGICARSPDGAPSNPARAARQPAAHPAVARVMDIIASPEPLARWQCSRSRAGRAVREERYHPLIAVRECLTRGVLGGALGQPLHLARDQLAIESVTPHQRIGRSVLLDPPVAPTDDTVVPA